MARKGDVSLVVGHTEGGWWLVERTGHGWLKGTVLASQSVHQFRTGFCVVAELVVVGELVVA